MHLVFAHVLGPNIEPKIFAQISVEQIDAIKHRKQSCQVNPPNIDTHIDQYSFAPGLCMVIEAQRSKAQIFASTPVKQVDANIGSNLATSRQSTKY